MNDTVAQAAEAVEVQPSAADAAGSPKPQAGERPARADGKGGSKKPKKNKAKQREQQNRSPAIKLNAPGSGYSPSSSHSQSPSLDDLGRPRRQRPSEQGRRDNTVPRSNREVSRENMINFKPLASHPAELSRVALQTEYTLRLFLDHYGRAQISLYNLICYLPIRMRQSRVGNERAEVFLDALEELIDNRIADVTKRLKLDLSRMEKVCKDNGVVPVTTYSKDAQEVTLPQLTPQIADLLGLLPLFDRYISHVDALWIGRYIKTRARETAINSYRNDVVTLIRYLMHLYHESKRLLEKGDGGDFVKLLRQPVEEAVLPERLDGADEAAAQAITGGEAPEAAPIAA